MQRKLLLKTIIALFTGCCIIGISLFSCKSDQEESEDEIESAIEEEIDSTASTLIKFNNTLFSIPSPYEIAILVKDLNIAYNPEYLSPKKNIVTFTNDFKKGLNLGVYGADLGYLNIYEQNPEAINYFSIVKMLSQELNISNAFDKPTIERIENNMGNKDSLLYILSSAYRRADTYLKENNRNDIGVLILAGGWIESLYILSQIASEHDHPKIAERIGEQKYPLDNLIKVLSPYYNKSGEYSRLIDALIELAYEFDGIDFNYTYISPTVDIENKVTTIHSKSEITINQDQLDIIVTKIEAIRTSIIE